MNDTEGSPDRLHEAVAFHRRLLCDARRNRAFSRALRAVVRPGARVLDLGAGTGIWSVLAARLGAREVVAVEREPLLRPLIEAAARDNGVAQRVRVVVADARHLEVPRRFDVVVSETIGNEGFDERIVELMSRARGRFLRRGGAVVPAAIELMAAPVSETARPGDGTTLDWSAFEAVAAHFPRGVEGVFHLAARPATLCRADLGQAAAMPRGPLAASWHLRPGARISAVAVWVAAELAAGIRLDTLRGTHWVPTLYPVDADFAPGRRLAFALHPVTGGAARWQVAGDQGHREHGPIYGLGAVAAHVAAVTTAGRRSGKV